MSGTRTSFGFGELRKRYIRKARFLDAKPEFREAMVQTREYWNSEQPDYRIVPGEPGPRGGPVGLEQAIDARGKEVPLAGQDRSAFAAGNDPLRDAALLWILRVYECTTLCFPLQDFANPYQWLLHPAIPFMQASLHAVERTSRLPLVENCDQYFREFVLLPEPMNPTPWGGEVFRQFVNPDPDAITWFIPLYPGITHTDIRAAAKPIAQAAETIFEGRTAGDRVRALHAEGWTFQQIADQLGMEKTTVADALKS